MPFSPQHLVAFIFLLALLVTFVQLGVLTVAFDKLGLAADSALLLLAASLVGSVINLPLISLPASSPPVSPPSQDAP